MREDRIYTLHQAARRLALPAKALRVLVDDGTIPHVKAGGHVLIELTAAEEAIARRARELPAEPPPAAAESIPDEEEVG